MTRPERMQANPPLLSCTSICSTKPNEALFGTIWTYNELGYLVEKSDIHLKLLGLRKAQIAS